MDSLVTQKQSWLSWFLRGILVLALIILFARLFVLQIIKGNYYRNLSENNRIREAEILAPRGKILARGGEVLVGNSEVKKRIVFSPQKGFEKIDDLTNATKEEIISDWVRYYPLGSSFGSVSGYLGQINEKELSTIDPKCPEKGVRKNGTLVGRAGLEDEYECQLSGVNGEVLVEIDTRGKKIRTLGSTNPIAGKDLKTSIDFGLQKKVAEVMGSQKGAVIVADKEGHIMAFYSSPSYDPSVFINNDQVAITSVLKDPNLPLFNRAIGGKFHPGSVFKPVVAVAALMEGKIDANYLYTDPGVINIDKYSYSNWFFTGYGKTEGTIDLTKALARSTDTFFYKIGEFVGIDNLYKWAKKFGYEEKTGIDLPGEISGLIPNPTWKKQVMKESWFLGNTYHFSIGQGDLSVTPIEVERALIGVATNRLCTLSIAGNSKCQDLKIKKEYLDLIKEGMIKACSTGGTGYTFFDFKIPGNDSLNQVACKTGTAETNVDGKTHAWFTAYGPVDFPEIFVTVLVERGGEGSKVAGPIARDIFNYYFNLPNGRN